MLRFFLVIISLCLIVGDSVALPQGWISATGVTGSTNNLFADSTETPDSYSNLNVVYEQPFNDNILFYYDGLGELYYETSELSNLDHNAGIEAGKYISDRGEIFAGIGGFMLNYREDYSLFNRQGARLVSGFRWIGSPSLRWRSGLNLSYNDYPKDDTLNVAYTEANLYLGMNLATRQKIALDIAPGIQFRRYGELETPATTNYFWINSRISRPVSEKMGISIGATFRDQLSTAGDEILALVQGGLDPGDLLWSGYSANLSVNYGSMPWFISVEILLEQNEYTESFEFTGYDQRTDDVVELRFSGKYVLDVPLSWPMVSVGTNLSYIDNSSSYSYYTYSGYNASLYLVIRSR